MAISLSSSIIKSNREKALKDLQKKASKAAKGESRRKGLSSILGTVGGMGLGALAASLTGITGGLALPLIMGLSSSAAKGLTDAASKGKFGKTFKTPGQTGKITSGSKYGYGAEEAGDIQEALQESRDATSWTPQSMLEDIALSYLAAGVGGKLDVGKDVMGGNFSKAMTGVDNYSLADAPIAELLESMPNVDTNIDFNSFTNTLNNRGTVPDDYFSSFKNGGMIPKYYGGGKVNTNNNTLYDYFAAQGKTMGGSDTMSIAQKLGRR